MQPNERETDDCLLAAILAVGLGRGLFAKRDVIRWADREIERRSEAPAWLIDFLQPLALLAFFDGFHFSRNASTFAGS